MSEVPTFLHPDIAATFEVRDVVASYRCRPTYPPQTLEILAGWISDEAPAVLDLGCGSGFIARPLASRRSSRMACDGTSAHSHP